MGGRQSVFFDEAMGETVAQRFAIEQALRRALGAQELRLYLQPQTDATGRWHAAEALVRWQHPTQGLVPPAAFIPVAEDCDLIAPPGAWVLEATCAELGQLACAGCRLPIHEIKIDRSFVQDAPRDTGSAALVEAIIAVAERLRLRVVAEGVETPEHAAYFARWPHVRQQGYLHGRPEPVPSVLARWLADYCPGGVANGAQ